MFMRCIFLCPFWCVQLSPKGPVFVERGAGKGRCCWERAPVQLHESTAPHEPCLKAPGTRSNHTGKGGPHPKRDRGSEPSRRDNPAEGKAVGQPLQGCFWPWPGHLNAEDGQAAPGGPKDLTLGMKQGSGPRQVTAQERNGVARTSQQWSCQLQAGPCSTPPGRYASWRSRGQARGRVCGRRTG